MFSGQVSFRRYFNTRQVRKLQFGKPPLSPRKHHCCNSTARTRDRGEEIEGDVNLRFLGEDVFDHFAVNVGQPKVTPLVSVGQLGVIDA